MRIIIDATPLTLYPVGKEGFHGGTELYVKKLAQGLPVLGHAVHVVTPDLEVEEQRGDREFWWPKDYHPTVADAVVMVHNLEHIEPYSAPLLILASNGLGADLGPNDEFCTGLDAVACFSQTHRDYLVKVHPKMQDAHFYITGLGIDARDFGDEGISKVPGRLLYANDPQRGLWDMLNIFEIVREQLPYATLHLTYDWERVFEKVKWGDSYAVQRMWECKRKIEEIPGITNMGALTREQVIKEQLECQVHVMPSNPGNLGSQIHGITQLECAAAGAALVLSNIEAFPEVFGESAELLPPPGTFDPNTGERWTAEDWAATVLSLLTDEQRLQEASSKARAHAERYTWDVVIENWGLMLDKLEKEIVA